MTPMPARIGLEPDVWDVLLQQVQDENAALHVENGRLRAENERLRSEGRHHTSPWRTAKEMLQQDPQAALPSVTS